MCDKPAMYTYVDDERVCFVRLSVCTCMCGKVCERGVLRGVRGGNQLVAVGVCGHVCGNTVLLTSHTLFSCSYKPLMPQKMLNLLWPGTAEGEGNWAEAGIGRRGLASACDYHGCLGYRLTSLSCAFRSSSAVHTHTLALGSATWPHSRGFGQAGFSRPMLNIQKNKTNSKSELSFSPL